MPAEYDLQAGVQVAGDMSRAPSTVDRVFKLFRRKRGVRGRDGEIVGTHTTLPASWDDMSLSEQKLWVRRLLEGMSPNPEVRQRSAQRRTQP